MTRYTVKVPVQMLGEPAHTDMKVKVKVDLTATTAMDDAYTAIPSEITIPRGFYCRVCSGGDYPGRAIGMDERDTVFRVVLQPGNKF